MTDERISADTEPIRVPDLERAVSEARERHQEAVNALERERLARAPFKAGDEVEALLVSRPGWRRAIIQYVEADHVGTFYFVRYWLAAGDELSKKTEEAWVRQLPKNENLEVACRHCGRSIVKDEDGAWVDPEATGDDIMWRETCEANHNTMDAEPEAGR